MNAYPKACVILGAGAAYDIHGEGSEIIDDEYRPPLAIDLFDINEHHAYSEVLQRYPGAEFLAQNLAALVTSGQESIENSLRHYAEHSNPIIRRYFKQIPGYLRDLLFLASYRYTSVPSSYIQLVTELLAERPHHLLFIVLNYDTLLESALNRFDNGFQFNTIAAYVDGERPVKVVKLHGSINWFKFLGPAPPGGNNQEAWINQLTDYDIFQTVHENEILITDVASTYDYTGVKEPRSLYYSIITAPLAGKDISKTVCPQSHIEVASGFLKDCHKFLIIGTSGLDEDLLSLMDSVLASPVTHQLVHIVDSGRGADEARTRFMKGTKAFRNHIPIENVFRNGFRHYLQNEMKSFSESRM